MLSISSATGGGHLYTMWFLCDLFIVYGLEFGLLLYCIAFENVICNSWIIGYLILVWISCPACIYKYIFFLLPITSIVFCMTKETKQTLQLCFKKTHVKKKHNLSERFIPPKLYLELKFLQKQVPQNIIRFPISTR